MSELRDRAMALAALVEAFGVKLESLTPVRTRVYEEGVQDIPIPLLNAAVRKAISTRTFLPKVAELRADAEACRKELLERHPYEACELCNHLGTVKVRSVELGSGHKVPKYERCSCYTRWQQQIEGMGATLQPLALPPAREDSDAA